MRLLQTRQKPFLDFQHGLDIDTSESPFRFAMGLLSKQLFIYQPGIPNFVKIDIP